MKIILLEFNINYFVLINICHFLVYDLILFHEVTISGMLYHYYTHKPLFFYFLITMTIVFYMLKYLNTFKSTDNDKIQSNS